MWRVVAIGLALQLTACTTRESNDAPAPACDNLFGRPNEKTGLDSTRCRPSCGCGDAGWVAPEWTAAKVDSLLSFTLLDPPAELTADPYKSPPSDSTGVCAVRIVDRAARTYRLESHATAAEATASGAIVTHENKCGLCSTLADLAVYATKPDLTDPVRSCGLDAAGNLEKNVSCLQKLGFTRRARRSGRTTRSSRATTASAPVSRCERALPRGGRRLERVSPLRRAEGRSGVQRRRRPNASQHRGGLGDVSPVLRGDAARARLRSLSTFVSFGSGEGRAPPIRQIRLSAPPESTCAP